MALGPEEGRQVRAIMSDACERLTDGQLVGKRSIEILREIRKDRELIEGISIGSHESTGDFWKVHERTRGGTHDLGKCLVGRYSNQRTAGRRAEVEGLDQVTAAAAWRNAHEEPASGREGYVLIVHL